MFRVDEGYYVKRGVYTFQMGLLCLMVVGLHVTASAQSIVRAKLGIQIHAGDQTSLAKTRDRLKKGDQLRVYVLPEQPGTIYLIYSNQKNAILLATEKAMRLEMATFPSRDQLYEIDGQSRIERLTIIYSPNSIEEVATVFTQDAIPLRQWQALEKRLLAESKIDLSQTLSTPFGIAGNVRSQQTLKLVDPGYQSHAVGDRVSLTIQADTPVNAALTFKAKHLPPGLSIDPATGMISGVVSSEALKRPSYRVNVSAANDTVSGSTTFIWSIMQDDLPQRLRVSSGKLRLVKRYEFTIRQ